MLYANEREMQAKRELEKQLAEQAKQIEMLSKLFGKVEGMAGADSSMKKLLDESGVDCEPPLPKESVDVD